jgi:hypothetical protein
MRFLLYVPIPTTALDGTPRGLPTMAIDNAVASPFDLSALPSYVRLVVWDNGKGFIERNDTPGVRSNFSDPTPYVPFVNSFITVLSLATPPIILDQAKSIKSDLVDDLFSVKSQAPITVVVSAGSYTWDASAEGANAMQTAMLPMAQQYAHAVNAFVNNINSAMINQYTPWSGSSANAVQGDFFTMWLAQQSSLSSGVTFPGPIPLLPYGATAPVSLTLDDFVTILKALNVRRTSLAAQRNSKKNSIALRTSIPDVVSADITSGW